MDLVSLRFIYRGLKARYRDHRTELVALISSLRQDDVAIDVGANKGSFTFSLARSVPNGAVFAFEPQPVLAEYLKVVTRSAQLANVIVEGVGLSDRAGVMKLSIPGDGGPSPGATLESRPTWEQSCGLDVPITTLDEYFKDERRRIGAIKIDVEGHEMAVLRGGEKVIRVNQPTIVCEIERRHMSHGNVETVLDYFRSIGYDGFFVHRSVLIPISEFDAVSHQVEDGERFWDGKDYCNNFVLRPSVSPGNP